MILQDLNAYLQSNSNEPFQSAELVNLITGSWSCKLKVVQHRTRNIINLDNNLIIRWIRDTIEIIWKQNVLYKSPAILTEEITLSLALAEGFIRIQNSKSSDGTYKLISSNVAEYIPNVLSLSKQHIFSFGEPSVFIKEEALKNMSGLEYWLHTETYLEPSQSLENKGYNLDGDYILFLAIEPYEYVSTIQDQLILKLSNDHYSNEYFLTYSEEEFGDFREQESLRKLHIKQKVISGSSTCEEINLVDILSRNWLLRNEIPGPSIYFISTQTNHAGKTILQNYNYNGKWFTFDAIECPVGVPQKNIAIQIGSNYQGKIKEIFLFNRKLVSENTFEDQSIKWIMAYLKQKYAITDTLINLK